MICEACNSTCVVQYDKMQDDRHGCPVPSTVFRCPQCGCYWIRPSAPISAQDLYQTYYPRRVHSLDLDETLEQYLDLIGRPAQVGELFLDIGCGSGQFLFQAEQRGFHGVGIDATTDAKLLSKSRRIAFLAGVFQKIRIKSNRMGVISMNQVLEHSDSPMVDLHRCYQLLKPGGKFFVSIPNADSLSRKLFRRSWIHWHTPYHAWIPTAGGLERLAHSTGFVVLMKKSITPPKWYYLQIAHLLLKGTSGRPSTLWSPGESKNSFSQAFYIRILNQFWKMRVFHVFAKISDRLCKGDCLTIIFQKPGSEKTIGEAALQ